MEMLKHYIRAPESGPIAFSRRRGLSDKEHRRRLPKERFYGLKIVTILCVDQLLVQDTKVLPRLITQRVSDGCGRCHVILRSHNAGKKYGQGNCQERGTLESSSHDYSPVYQICFERLS